MPTEPEILADRALAILRRHGPMRGSDLGWQLWGETTESPDRGEGSRRQNKFCRSAGKLLRRLEREGRARWTPHPGYTLWRATTPAPEKGGPRD